MDFGKQLFVIKQAQGDPAMLALTTVDLAYPDLPDDKKVMLKETLKAVAISHWCDETILAALLQIPQEESAARLSQLCGLSVVETFPARGNSAVNIHEASRLALRKRLVKEDQSYFRMLSGRAAAYFMDDFMPSGHIEWIYHLLCGEPERGAKELEKLYRAWSSTAHHEDAYALALALRELEDSQMVENRARVWTLITIAWSRYLHGEVSQLANVANQVLSLAKEAKDQVAEGEAKSMLGDVLQAQGNLEAAQAAFEQCLTISRRLAEQDPSNAGWQQGLGVAHSRVGDVLQAQGNLEAAQAAFEQYLTISRRLAEQDPSNAGWQRELGVAYSRVGDVLQAQGNLEAAQAAFEQYLTISRRLAEQDPSNAGWQRELGVAYSRVGDVLQAQGNLEAAQAAFEQYLTISRRLAEQDPSNAGWQRGLGVAYSRVGDVLQAQGNLEAAQAAFEQYLTISRRLVEQDSNNAN